MPMIDVYAAVGTVADRHRLAVNLASAVMTIDQVPDIRMFRRNTAAFVHGLPDDGLSNVGGEARYVHAEVARRPRQPHTLWISARAEVARRC